MGLLRDQSQANEMGETFFSFPAPAPRALVMASSPPGTMYFTPGLAPLQVLAAWGRAVC